MNQLYKITIPINKKILLISSLVFITGLSTGFFLESFMKTSDKTHLISIITNNTSLLSGKLTYLLLTNAILLALILLLALSVYGAPLSSLVLFAKGLASGLSAPLVWACVDPLEYFTHFLLPTLILSFIYIVSVTICISYALPKMHT